MKIEQVATSAIFEGNICIFGRGGVKNEQRTKGKFHQYNGNTGDVVLIKQSNIPPCIWPLTRVIDTHPGPDGILRVFTVKTSGIVVKRPISIFQVFSIIFKY